MFQNLAPVTRAIIVANFLVFGIQYLLGDWTTIYFALWPWHTNHMPGVPPFEIWQLVTYGFMHGGFTHILFNMFAVFMFGSDIERSMGTQKYVLYYFVCVIGAAVAQVLVMAWTQASPTPTVGASGGIFGLLLAFGIAFPHRRVMLLFPPIPMPAWVFVTLYGVMELGMGVLGTNQGVAHFAHLGGMGAGYLLIQYWRRRKPQSGR